MPASATLTAFYTFSPGVKIKSAEHNNNWSAFRGHLIAVDGSLGALAVTNSYDLGDSTRYWRAGYITQVNSVTLSASSIVTTTLTASSIQTTTLTASSIVGTTITGTNFLGTGLSIFNGFGKNVTTVSTTGSYSIAGTDDTVLFTAGGSATAAFPAASSFPKRIIAVKKVDSTFNTITISGTGMSTNYLMTVGETAMWQSDGSNWIQIYRKTDTGWITMTPTGTWSTNSTFSGRWRRVGRNMDFRVHIALAGAPTSASLGINYMPPTSSWTVDTTSMPTTATDGTVTLAFGTTKAAGVLYDIYGYYNSTTQLAVICKNSASTYVGASTNVTQAIPATYTNNDTVQLSGSVPITNFSA